MESVRFNEQDLRGRVARFADLEGNEGGFPDSELPGCERTLYNVLGFRAPDQDEDGYGGKVMSPIGAKSSAKAPIDISEGFNLAFVETTPGNGTLLHNHDTNETFVILTGRWRFHCNDDEDLSIDLGPWDTVSFPPGLPRRFMNLRGECGEQNEKSQMVVIIAGSQPQAVMEPDVLTAAQETGRFTPAWSASS